LALAARAKFPASSIALFEGGARKPSLENLRRLVVALDISADYLPGRAKADKMKRDDRNKRQKTAYFTTLMSETPPVSDITHDKCQRN